MTREGFDKALSELQQEMLRMGSMVEEAIHLAVESLAKQDLNLAQTIVDGDDRIDNLSQQVEDDCIRLIALQQPLARDLRVVTTVLKTATDLERIADHATNIAEITPRIAGEPLIKPLIDIPRMASLVEAMVQDSLKAFVDRDVELAKRTCLRDDEVDQLYENLFNELTGYVLAGGENHRVVQALNLLFAARYLERVGDHATNIGERVIYLVTGRNERY
ncbi:PhoU-like phosphate uptake regulator [Hydrogenispora ethanolica]|jgi:phosphate transport system protein|uniref:Phosphate-specific transport system accessory protein PhoU n=1 Tax=Hydrogenispora ethanolica TaxID=1082276 RepID=A0A4R1RU61_HYDET|nr:phosphate signaling complex protein PhoU [Hydrogenispora ethanolica]TCL70098.1 PhoU-like phosphate uptake regulator [Hydrogenispora ethanolica]